MLSGNQLSHGEWAVQREFHGESAGIESDERGQILDKVEAGRSKKKYIYIYVYLYIYCIYLKNTAPTTHSIFHQL